MSRYTLRTVNSNGHVIGGTRTVTIAAPPGEDAPPPPPVDTAYAAAYPEGGTAVEILDWVDDPTITDRTRSDRAKAAIVAEHGREKPRTTLLAKLNERTGQ